MGLTQQTTQIVISIHLQLDLDAIHAISQEVMADGDSAARAKGHILADTLVLDSNHGSPAAANVFSSLIGFTSRTGGGISDGKSTDPGRS